jgi:N utilization substance protein B
VSSIIVGRTRARSQAIQIIFQAESQNLDVFDLLAGGEYVLEDGPADDYAVELARGVAVNRIAIDRMMGAVSRNWNLSRMPRVDRCIMAVALYEMFFVEAVPTSVAINEAVELSKVYGTDDSSSFVNGILGRIARLAEANPGTPLAVLAQLTAAGTVNEAAPAVEKTEEVVEPVEPPAAEPAGEVAAAAAEQPVEPAEQPAEPEPAEAPVAPADQAADVDA